MIITVAAGLCPWNGLTIKEARMEARKERMCGNCCFYHGGLCGMAKKPTEVKPENKAAVIGCKKHLYRADAV